MSEQIRWFGPIATSHAVTDGGSRDRSAIADQPGRASA